MKKLLTLLLFVSTLFASSLQKVPSSFSEVEKDELLKEFLKSSNALYTSDTYNLKKGYNRLTTPKNGVNPLKTFNDSSIVKFVVTYDEVSQIWAIYKPSDDKLEGKILLLKYLEPAVTFFVWAKKDATLEIKYNIENDICKKLMDDKEFDFIIDSGMNRDSTMSKDKSISLKSRYFSHNKRGVYNDTRVLFIYPKLNSKTSRTYKYGPAIPKIALEFSKEYENKKFYIYDYYTQECYKGIFPSMKVPPFPLLQKL